MPSSTAVLLDVDGTLVDSTYHHALAWQRAFDRHHLPVPVWRIHRAIGMGGDKLVAHVAGDRVEDRHGDAIRDAWREEYLAIRVEVFPLPGATDLVRAIGAAGWTAAVASSGDPQFAREAVATLGIRDDVALLTTADDADASKPESDLVEVTLARLGAERAVMVGDTPYDVLAAERAGLRCLAVRSGGYAAAELLDAGAVLVVDGPEDLVDLDWEQHLAEVPRPAPTDRS